VPRASGHADQRARGGFIADYGAVLSNRWARIVIVAAFIEGAAMWGAFAYIGADLKHRYGISLTLVGLTVACFGIGGLIYASTVKLLVGRLGQTGLAIFGGLILTACYMALAWGAAWWLAPVAVVWIGLGFYMLHNTLQTNATQMTPEARGTAVAVFSSSLYIGQTAGVAVGGLMFDRLGPIPLFVSAAVVLPAMAIWFAHELKRHRATNKA
jgi:predicted MFS family arabinose efflux permease